MRIRKRFALPLVAVLAGVALVVLWQWKRSRKPEIHYQTIRVKRGALEINVLSTGTVAPENRLNIQAPIAGRAEQVLVDQGHTVKKGQILAWISSTERAALLDGARAEGPAELQRWETLYKASPVIAPVDGMIIQRNVQPGQTFSTTDPILVMSDHLIVQVQVDETDISQIHVNQPAAIVLDAYPNDRVPGRVQKIAYDAKTVNNVTTYEVDVRPHSVPKFMRSGMTANVTFPVGKKEDVLLLPADALKTRDGNTYVMVPAADGRKGQVPRDVSIGISQGDQVEVVSGLSEGEAVLEPEVKVGPEKKSPSNPFAAFGGHH